MAVRIAKNGKLIEVDLYNQESDVTDTAIRYLFEPCTLEEGVTLKDIFLLLNSNLAMFDTVLGNWCCDIVTEGLSQPAKVFNGYNKDEIEYLELCYYAHYNDKEKCEFHGTHRPDFGGIGWELRENVYHDWDDKETGSKAIEYEKGSRISWSLSYTPSSEIINLPVKLSNKMAVYNSDTTDGNYMKELYHFMDPEYTLGEILNGIIWELSFHGLQTKDETNPCTECGSTRTRHITHSKPFHRLCFECDNNFDFED